MRVRNPLAVKVFAGVFATAACLVMAMSVASVWRVDRSFGRYVERLELERLEGLVELLQRERLAYGDWRFVPGDPEGYRRWFSRAMGGVPGPDPTPLPDRPPRHDPEPPPDWPPPHDRGPPPDRGLPPEQGRPADHRPPPEWGPPRRRATGEERGGDPMPREQEPPPAERRPPPDRLALLRRVALFDAGGVHVGGAALAMEGLATRPIVVEGLTVGFVGLQAQTSALADGEQSFLQEQWRDALLVGLAALLLSGLVSWLFALHLRRPVRQLVDGTQALAEGSLSTRLPVDRRDEFGLIAGHFNRMADQLQQQERLRREWLANTSHELRTPLTVLRALIEALQEGIRRGDAATLQRLHDQVMSLSRLVDDLYQLAQHDAGQAQIERRRLRPRDLIDDVLDAQRPRLLQAGIAVELVDHSGDTALLGDPQRLAQLVHNLIENTLRYTDAPGRLRITLSATGETRTGREWRAEFEDTAPGVADPALPRLFERFYRGEASRSRATGGSGLGLAICRAIVDAHGGRIHVQPSSLGGLGVTVILPAEDLP